MARNEVPMFCSECGARTNGKFCSSCGHKLQASDIPTPNIIPLSADWSDIVDYETLLRIPEVRDAISRSAAQAKKSMTGEEILDVYFKALGKMAGLPIAIPVSRITQFTQSAYAKMGIKTGKQRSELIAQSAGKVLVSILCSLASNNRTLRSAHQLADGCILVAVLPSDLYALEGDLIITVTRAPQGTRVEARTDIQGQLFDWGKSTRCLEALFTELITPAAA
jgi:hypothetical protein